MRILIFALLGSSAFAQTARIVNARMETHAVTAALQPELRRLMSAGRGPEWVGYAEPAVAGEHHICCGNYNDGRQCRGCTLESGTHSGTVTTNTAGSVKLEGPGAIAILLRLAGGRIDQLQVYSIDCELDAGGLPFHWLTGVSPAASVDYLESIVPEYRHAVMTIALHADARADGALERLSRGTEPEKVREDVAFWLGSARGRRGLEILKSMLGDQSDRLREKLMFAFSVSKEPGALTQLLESARLDASPRVRGQALFWLAQKAGDKETAAITRAIAEDPDTEVKKHAVFALQQLPRDEGIPLLIQVARANKNPEVRKQAMFWLGQSRDPRALKFFEEVLTK